MNVYDPADLILYVHMPEKAPARSFPVGGGTTCITLPSGYANQSPADPAAAPSGPLLCRPGESRLAQ